MSIRLLDSHRPFMCIKRLRAFHLLNQAVPLLPERSVVRDFSMEDYSQVAGLVNLSGVFKTCVTAVKYNPFKACLSNARTFAVCHCEIR